MKPEAKLEAKLKAYFKSNEGLFLKFTSPSTAGVPDRLILKNGRTLFVELKAPGRVGNKSYDSLEEIKKLDAVSPLQKERISELKYEGQEVWVSDDYESLKKIIESL